MTWPENMHIEEWNKHLEAVEHNQLFPFLETVKIPDPGKGGKR